MSNVLMKSQLVWGGADASTTYAPHTAVGAFKLNHNTQYLLHISYKLGIVVVSTIQAWSFHIFLYHLFSQ